MFMNTAGQCPVHIDTTSMSARSFVACVVAAISLALSGPLPLAAKQLYEYVDENGIRHFTDVPPQTDQPVKATRVQVENRPLLRLETRAIEGGTGSVVIAHNLSAGPIEVGLDFSQAENVVSNPALPVRAVVAARSQRELARVAIADRRGKAAFGVHAEAVPGDPRHRPDPVQRYRLPLPSGTRYAVSQSFGGQFSHTDRQNYYAVDLGVAEGTPVVAARDGVVIQVERDFFESGTDRDRLASRANYVRVLHEDGTMALYAHLAFETVLVRPGDAVLAGQKLGEAGDIGFATGPHLHFVIQRNTGMRLEAIPFQFDGSGGPFTPERSREWQLAP